MAGYVARGYRDRGYCHMANLCGVERPQVYSILFIHSALAKIVIVDRPGILYLVPTPIGNLSDMSARAIEVLSSVSLIACEDTRTSGVLLNHYGITTPRTSFHAHNEHGKEQNASLMSFGSERMLHLFQMLDLLGFRTQGTS